MALLKDAVLSAAADPVFGAHTTPLIAPSRPDELRGYMFCHNPSAPRRAKKHPHAFLDPPFLFNVQVCQLCCAFNVHCAIQMDNVVCAVCIALLVRLQSSGNCYTLHVADAPTC